MSVHARCVACAAVVFAIMSTVGSSPAVGARPLGMMMSNNSSGAHSISLAAELITTSGSAVLQVVTDTTSPAGIAQLLVSRHIGGKIGFDTTSVVAKRRWLSEVLLVRLAQYFAGPVKDGDMPAIDFDPFINEQDYPTAFTIGVARPLGNRMAVRVRFADGVTRYTVIYMLRRERGVWRITDIRSRRGDSLMAMLK